MTSKQWTYALVATSVVSACCGILALRILEDESDDAGGIPGTLRSTVLGEEREYVVHLPEGYGEDPSGRYPVLYVLDGGSQSGHSAESASLLARIGVSPAIIVVGVPSIDGETRNRDYTPPDMRLDSDAQGGAMGSAELFLSFLQAELIERVEQDYRTTRPRMLAGWSRGGLFVVHSAIVAPSLFDARFAHSPALWRESDMIVTKFAKALAEGPPLEGFLYLSLGSEENEKMSAAFRRMAGVLERTAPATLRWRADVTAGGRHETNARLATPVGLCAMFSAGGDGTCSRKGFQGLAN